MHAGVGLLSEAEALSELVEVEECSAVAIAVSLAPTPPSTWAVSMCLRTCVLASAGRPRTRVVEREEVV